jgi:multiple sugar transport system permease protein
MKRSAGWFRKYAAAYLFVLPCAIVLFLMMLNPVVRTFIYSFSKIELPSFRTTWVGMQNVTRVFSLPAVPQVLWNTLVWVVGTIVFRFTLGFWAALALNAQVKGRVVLRTLALLPWTVPSIVAANTWRWMLQSDIGLVNGFLKKWGLDALAVNWLGSPQTALGSVLTAYAWAGYPFVMIMLLAGMQGISEDLYDAGKIDGANAAQAFLHITLPSLRNVIVILLILEVISGFNSFDLLFIMTGGGPGGASEILGLFIYRLGFTNFDFAGASAVSTVLIVVAVLCFLLYVPASARRRRA